MGFVDKNALALAKESEAVINIVALLQAQGIADDDSMDLSISSETSFDDMIGKFLIEEGEIAAQVKALKDLVTTYQARMKAMEKRQEWIRTILQVALQQANLPKRKTAYGTITEKSVADVLAIDKEKEMNIPSRFWKEGDPVIRKAELKDYMIQRLDAIEVARGLPEDEREAALKAVDKTYPAIDGVELETDRKTIQIKR